MPVNKYLSKYSQPDVNFKRTDPWPHLPWAHEVRRSKVRMILGEVLGAVALVVVLVGAALIHDPEPVDNINVEVGRK